MSLDPARPGPPFHMVYEYRIPGIEALTRINVAFDVSLVISSAYAGIHLDPED